MAGWRLMPACFQLQDGGGVEGPLLLYANWGAGAIGVVSKHQARLSSAPVPRCLCPQWRLLCYGCACAPGSRTLSVGRCEQEVTQLLGQGLEPEDEAAVEAEWEALMAAEGLGEAEELPDVPGHEVPAGTLSPCARAAASVAAVVAAATGDLCMDCICGFLVDDIMLTRSLMHCAAPIWLTSAATATAAKAAAKPTEREAQAQSQPVPA